MRDRANAGCGPNLGSPQGDRHENRTPRAERRAQPDLRAFAPGICDQRAVARRHRQRALL